MMNLEGAREIEFTCGLLREVDKSPRFERRWMKMGKRIRSVSILDGEFTDNRT